MQKNYYAIIPANVRYDNDLPANAKLLYGEITALCNQEGYCWASNEYFSELYSVSKSTITRWISELVKKKYLNLKLIYKTGTREIEYRVLTILSIPILKNNDTPILKNEEDNNTFINNTIEYIDKDMSNQLDEKKEKKKIPAKKKGFIPPTVEEFSEYFRQNGYPTALAEKAWRGYSEADWFDSHGNKVRNWKQKAQHVWFREENKSSIKGPVQNTPPRKNLNGYGN